MLYDVQEIPPPSRQRSLETLPINASESLEEITFDIEATG